MAAKVIWSPRAENSFNNILEYLERHWTQKEINAFIARTEEVISYIQENPQYYPYSQESDTYRCVMREQVSLYYRIKNDYVELMLFWDNRRNPYKLKLK